MEATARAGGARLDGEGLPKVEDDDVLLDVGVDGAPAGLGRNAGEAGEDEVAAMPKEVVTRFGAARHDGEGWPEFAGVVERGRREEMREDRGGSGGVCGEWGRSRLPFIGRGRGGERPGSSPAGHQWRRFTGD